MTIILGLLALAGVVLIVLYNGLVRSKNIALEAWSGIDVQLKRRSDLIPNLLETVKGYAAHERGVMEKVTSLRAQSQEAKSPTDRAKIEGQMSAALANLFAVAENYPDLKASQNFQELQKSLSDIEEQLQMARRFYNGAVRELNVSIQSFPGNMVAGMFHFMPMEFFELENAADKAVPKVSF